MKSKIIVSVLILILFAGFVYGEKTYSSNKDVSLFNLYPRETLIEQYNLPVKIDPAWFEITGNKSKEVQNTFWIVNDSEQDFVFNEVVAPAWVELTQPSRNYVPAHTKLSIPFLVKTIELPVGTTIGVIEISSLNNKLFFPIEANLNDQLNLNVDFNQGELANLPGIIIERDDNEDDGVGGTDENVFDQDRSGNYCCDPYPSNGQAMEMGRWYYAAIDYSGDIDWWEFYCDAPVDYRMRLDVPNGHDFDLDLYAGCNGSYPNCTASDYIGRCSNSGDEDCYFTPNMCGKYYIKVFGYQGDYDPNNPYGLNVSHYCENECNSGQKRCSGDYSETCGNYDSDSCTEWGNRQYCQNGCSNGQCNQCQSHSYSACFDNDRYWYNSCNQREDKRQDCGDDSYSGYYCYDNDVYRDFIDKGCQSDACFQNTYREKISECGSAGCSNGQCNVCNPHDHTACYNNDRYWFNSCNEPEELYEDCRVSCSDNGYCINGCKGNFIVTVKNAQGQVEPNATISFKRMDMQNFQFVGLTDSNGQIEFSDIWPHSNACGINYEIKAVSYSGGDCGTRQTRIDVEGDRDGVMFRCPIVNNDNFLRIQPDAPVRIRLGQPLDLRAIITDRDYVPQYLALVGVIRPYNDTALSDYTDGQGLASFVDQGVPAGTHNFQFIASKANYKYAEAWKKVTVEPQQVRMQVRDESGFPVWHAEILLEDQTIGFTDNSGHLNLYVNEEVNTFEARNTNDIHCGYRTIRVGEQANFICPESPKLQVLVDTNADKPMSNVLVALDGELVDFTNAFGYTLSNTPTGTHTLEIYYQLDENAQKYMQQRRITLSDKTTVVSFIADAQHGTPIDGDGMALDGSEIRAQCPFCLAIIPVALLAVDVISISLDISDLCSCLDEKTEDSFFDFQACKNILTDCKSSGIDACSEPLRAAKAAFAACPLEYGSLAFDVGPGTGSGIASKIGLGAAFTKIGKKLDVKKFLNPTIEIFDAIKRRGQEIWDVLGKEWDYIATKIDSDKFLKQIKLKKGTLISAERSEIVDQTVKDLRERFMREGLSLGRLDSLVITVDKLEVEKWTDIQKEGFSIIVKKIDAEEADILLIPKKESGIWSDADLRQISEIVKNDPDRHFNVLIPNSGGKNADFWIRVGNTEFWTEQTQVWDKLYQGNMNDFDRVLYEKAGKFQNFPDQDVTIGIRLTKGTDPNVGLDFLENRIRNAQSNGRLPNIVRVELFDAIKLESRTVEFS